MVPSVTGFLFGVAREPLSFMVFGAALVLLAVVRFVVLGMSDTPSKMRVHLRLSRATYERLADCGGSVQDQIKLAINSYLSKRDRSGYREVMLSPRGNISVDQMLSWLAAGAPLLRDLQGSPGALHESIVRPMIGCLSPLQMSRMKKWVEGEKLSDIGRQEGVSKQAIHSSIQRSIRILSTNRDFLTGLCELFPESALTPEYLLMAANQKGDEAHG